MKNNDTKDKTLVLGEKVVLKMTEDYSEK